MFPKDTRVLIVDDMPKMREIVSSQVASLGYTDILKASNGREALDLLNQQFDRDKPIGLVFSDWNMPIMAGIDLLAEVRKSGKLQNVPFIMVTAEGKREQVMEAIKIGVSNYIVKPFPAVQLELKIKAVWDKLAAKADHLAEH